MRTRAKAARASRVGSQAWEKLGHSKRVPSMASASSREIMPTPLGQGHSTRIEPRSSPSNTAVVGRRKLVSRRWRRVEKRASPMAAPRQKTRSCAMAISSRAANRAAYMPTISSRNEPEMPGSTIAHIASAPAPR